MNFNLFGLNPKFKDFVEKYPNKTVIGVMWAMYWRFTVLILAVEFIVFALFIFVGLGVTILTS